MVADPPYVVKRSGPGLPSVYTATREKGNMGDIRDEAQGSVAGRAVRVMAPWRPKGTMQNLAGVPLGQIKVAGKALGPDDKLLGTATASTKAETIRPGQKAEVNLEFLTVTGPQIQQVKRHQVTVIEAPSKQ
jgi:hypothetical protein